MSPAIFMRSWMVYIETTQGTLAQELSSTSIAWIQGPLTHPMKLQIMMRTLRWLG